MSNEQQSSTPSSPATVSWGSDQITVVDARPMPVSMKEAPVTRRAVVNAVTQNSNVNLTSEAVYGLSYVTSPGNWEYVRDIAKHDMLSPRRPAAMHLVTAEVEALVPTLILGPQPRTETDPNPVAPPRVRGGVDGTEPIASLEIEFDDLQHFQDYTRQVVKSTDAAGAHYQVSIIENGVSEPITVVPVKVVLKDAGNGHPDHFTAYAVIDGITRAIRCVQVYLGHGTRIDDVANYIVSVIATPTGRADRPLHERMLATRNAGVDSWRHTHALGQITGAGLAQREASVRTAQAMTLRARVVLGCRPSPVTALALEDQFPDAAAELVRHTQENKAWRPEASAANAMHSVVRVLKGRDEVKTSVQAEYLLGQTTRADLPTVTALMTRSTEILSPSLAALFRGIYLVWFLTRPSVFKLSKQDLRTSLKLGLVRNTVFAATVAPLIEAPWRQGKASSLSQARNAYKRRGVFTDEVINTEWQIVNADPMDLYAKAVGGDDNARITLTVGGGIALIADRFLTTEVIAGTGSGGQYVAVWKPTSIDEVVRLLGHKDNHRGLLQLALAMQTFDIDKEAINGLGGNERARRTAHESARLYVVPSAAEDLLSSHQDGVLVERGSQVELTTELLLLIADYDGSRVAAYGRRRTGAPTPAPVTLQDLVDRFSEAVKRAADFAAQAVEKGVTDTSRPFVDEATQRDLARAQRAIAAHLDWIEDRAATEPTPYGEEGDLTAAEVDDYYEAAREDAEETAEETAEEADGEADGEGAA